MYLRGQIAFFLITYLRTFSAAKDWWEDSNIYQIYPRSFKDSDGDGIGDLKGITKQIDYLKELGMDGAWLSPIFQSPMVDFGYDISDFKAIQPEYGTIEDFMQLVEKAHSINLKIILDFVPNHTSDQHKWFQLSVQGDPFYRDFYIWHPGVKNSTTGKREPPSNWLSVFRGSAWEWNDVRQEFYYHQFSKQQPDLNFRNPDVIAAMDDVLHYWLSKNVDGFRIDAVMFIYEAEVDPKTGTYPDEPIIRNVNECPDPDDFCHLKHIHTIKRQESVDLLYHWRELMDNWARMYKSETKLLLTEAYADLDYVISMYGNDKRNGAQVPFNFELLVNTDNSSRADVYQYHIDEWLSHTPMGQYANWVLGNHDRSRIATRFGNQRIDLINILLQTLPGIAITYYGEELGMENVYIPWEDTVDPQGCMAGRRNFEQLSRDPVRTPFRWNNSTNAGFSTAKKTWLPVGPGYVENNVASQLEKERSNLKVFKSVNYLRRTEPAFNSSSDFEITNKKNVLLYKRTPFQNGHDAFIVILNIGSDNVELNLSECFKDVSRTVEIVVSSEQSNLLPGRKVDSTAFKVEGYVGYVVRSTRRNLFDLILNFVLNFLNFN